MKEEAKQYLKYIMLSVFVLIFLMQFATVNANKICELSKQTNITHVSFDKSCDDNKLNDIFVGQDIIIDIFKRNF